MSVFTILSSAEQVANHLREQLFRGRWSDTMPGAPTLAGELGIDLKTALAALDLLEQEGLLIPQGPGRRRKIQVPKDHAAPAMRIAILDYDPLEQTEQWTLSMQQLLMDQGHSPFFAEKSLTELGMDLRKITRLVKRTAADAWVVCSGPREVLEWFADQETPTFAMFGRRRDLPIAGIGPDHESAGRDAVRRLIALGHKRIVLLVRKSQRAGGLGQAERAKFEEMEAHGLSVSAYNLPDWEDHPDDLLRVLDGLFKITPPTALIIDEPFLFHAVKHHLAQMGVVAPTQVSLICADPDPTFAWCRPSIAHIRWDHRLVVRRVVQWANNVARGKDDRRQTLTKAEFVEGGTVGPVPAP